MAAFEAIASTTLTTTTSTVTFSSIPGTYEHLQLRFQARDAAATTLIVPLATLNNDSGANYVYHRVYGTGSLASADGNTASTYIQTGAIPAANATANCVSSTIVDVLDYASPSKNSTLRIVSGVDTNNTLGRVWVASGLWLNTSTINRVDITSAGSGFVAGSVFALYGFRSS